MAIFRNIHDPGLGEKYLSNNRRIINKDGSFNVKRQGLDTFWGNTYYFLINMSWLQFLSLVFGMYVLINILFGLLYQAIGVEHLKGAEVRHLSDSFFDALFFSFQTFTSVGYGGMSPEGLTTNCVSAFEAFAGLSYFALITGLLYGRFSRPSSRILFSRNALVSPYKEDGKSLQFRMVNRRHNVLMEMEATVILMSNDRSGQSGNKKFYRLDLEIPSIYFFALNWTIVHPITEESPLFGLSEQDIKNIDAEILIMIKGFDDTFGQIVYQRHSYKYDEIVHNARFKKAYDTNQEGHTVMDINQVHEFEKVEQEMMREKAV